MAMFCYCSTLFFLVIGIGAARKLDRGLGVLHALSRTWRDLCDLSAARREAGDRATSGNTGWKIGRDPG
jgi:hypothetical protein